MNIRWKIYFWIIAIGTIITLPNEIATITDGNLLINLASIIFVAMTIIGLFAFVFKKQIFTKTIWKTFFVIDIISVLVGLISILLNIKQFTANPEVPLPALLLVYAVIIIFIAPSYYAIYQLGFGKKK